ncbi:hypothetical protein [Listeria rocourtiae]|uniref:hypothetical protein n=1 Tax=Listeria rocourtiae TaxID=647910 RepID=UPI0003E8BC8C|nr:hypothetical protein [Listeria rocourtiae]EUJ47759.1 hypothetical protein PROCOU_07583 [Listeria rocourtiae FSL F6-920]
MIKKVVFSLLTVSALALAGCGTADETTKAEVKTSGHGDTTPAKSKSETAQIKELSAQFPAEPAKKSCCHFCFRNRNAGYSKYHACWNS